PLRRLHSFPTRRSSDLSLMDTYPGKSGTWRCARWCCGCLSFLTQAVLRAYSELSLYQLIRPMRTPRSVSPMNTATTTGGISLRRSEEHTSELQSPCNLV